MLHATGGVTLEDGVLLGPGVTVLTASHAMEPGEDMRTGSAIFKPVRIGAGAWLGGRCVVLDGRHVLASELAAAYRTVAATLAVDTPQLALDLDE